MASEQAFRAFPQVSEHPALAHNPKVAGSNPAPATKSPGQRNAGQGFSRVCGSSTGPSTGGSTLLLFDQLLERSGGFGLHPGEDVVGDETRSTLREFIGDVLSMDR